MVFYSTHWLDYLTKDQNSKSIVLRISTKAKLHLILCFSIEHITTQFHFLCSHLIILCNHGKLWRNWISWQRRIWFSIPRDNSKCVMKVGKLVIAEIGLQSSQVHHNEAGNFKCFCFIWKLWIRWGRHQLQFLNLPTALSNHEWVYHITDLKRGTRELTQI